MQCSFLQVDICREVSWYPLSLFIVQTFSCNLTLVKLIGQQGRRRCLGLDTSVSVDAWLAWWLGWRNVFCGSIPWLVQCLGRRNALIGAMPWLSQCLGCSVVLLLFFVGRCSWIALSRAQIIGVMSRCVDAWLFNRLVVVLQMEDALGLFCPEQKLLVWCLDCMDVWLFSHLVAVLRRKVSCGLALGCSSSICSQMQSGWVFLLLCDLLPLKNLYGPNY